MERNDRSIKKTNMISTASLLSTANPFIIYFYDLVEKVIQEKKLQSRQIWNCDE